MPFNDFDVFWRAALALLQGRDPYAMPGVYYPLPTFFLFMPLSVFPLEFAHVIWTLIEAIILLAILRQRVPFVALFMPLVLSFLMGQMVIPMLGVFVLLRSRQFGGVALGLLMLKPQLVFFLAPWLLWQWWRRDRKQIVVFLLVFMALGIAAFAAQPDWVYRWLTVSGERVRAPISPSVWGVFSFLPMPVWLAVAGLLAIGIFIWAWRKNDFDILMVSSMLINPVLISYDFTLLIPMISSLRFWLVMTMLSWITFGISAIELNERATVLLPLIVIILLVRQRQSQRTMAKRTR
jgi:hypothetical protein